MTVAFFGAGMSTAIFSILFPTTNMQDGSESVSDDPLKILAFVMKIASDLDSGCNALATCVE
jgi:urocanate hydratase